MRPSVSANVEAVRAAPSIADPGVPRGRPRDEFRRALPVTIPWLAFWSAGLVEHGLLSAPDLVPFRRAFSAFGDAPTVGLAGAVASLWLAGLLLCGQGTSPSLIAPRERTPAFLTKLTTGLVVLGAGPALHVAIAFLIGAASRTSVGSGPPIGIALAWTALAWTELAVIFGAALLLSFLGALRWLVAAALLLAYLCLVAVVPAARVLDVTRLAEPLTAGTAAVIPWGLVALHGTLGVACLVAAWRLHAGSGGTLVDAIDRLGDTAQGRTARRIAALLGAAFWIAVPAGLAVRAGIDDDPRGDEHGVVWAAPTRGIAAPPQHAR